MDDKSYEDEIDLVDYFKVIYKYRVMIFLVVVTSMLVSGVMSLTKPKIYEASATFFPLDTSSQIEGQGIIVRPGLRIEDLIVSVLESRKMADRIIEQLGLKEIWEDNLMEDARQDLRGASKISLGKNGIIKLAVQAQDPALSAKIANAYVDNLDYFNSELEIGPQRKIVQVIDRAVVPEKRLGRGTVKKAILAGVAACILSIFLVFFVEFFKNSNVINSLREK